MKIFEINSCYYFQAQAQAEGQTEAMEAQAEVREEFYKFSRKTFPVLYQANIPDSC